MVENLTICAGGMTFAIGGDNLAIAIHPSSKEDRPLIDNIVNNDRAPCARLRNIEGISSRTNGEEENARAEITLSGDGKEIEMSLTPEDALWFFTELRDLLESIVPGCTENKDGISGECGSIAELFGTADTGGY